MNQSVLHKDNIQNTQVSIADTTDYAFVYERNITSQWAVPRGYDVAADYSGNFYVTGAVQQGSSAYTDLFVEKINRSGYVVWNYTYDVSGNYEYGYGITYGANGNLYITGRTFNSTSGHWVLLLVKLNNDGTFVWAKAWQYPTDPSYDTVGVHVYGSSYSESNGIYVAGYVNKTSTDSDILLIKFDDAGNVIWYKTYDNSYTNDEDFACDIYVYPGIDQIVLVSGAISNGTAQQGIILKYKYDGTLLGTATSSDNHGSVVFTGITADALNNIYVVGHKVNVAILERYTNDTLTASGSVTFPESSKHSRATAIYMKSISAVYITGYVVNTYLDEFFWVVDAYSFTTTKYVTHFTGYDNYPLGLVSTPPAGIGGSIDYFIIAGYHNYFDGSEKYIYYWQIVSADNDDDSLSNFWEIRKGTDMSVNDTDGDGLFDGVEVYTYNTNPLNNDTDADGLLDGAEVNTYHTDPLNADTDGDGLLDSAEVNTYHTNPNSSDTDNDGLSDYAEINTYHTNATNPDTDGDGMPDGWEVQYELNPTNSSDAALDADNDGLTNVQEYQHNTNATNPDTDGDSMPDGWEVQYELNPTNSSDAAFDLDNDNLTNIQEFQHNTNPRNNDTDSDGMPDGWEVQYGLNPTNSSDASQDSDGDGLTNLQEYQQGKNPMYDDVPPKFISVWTEPNAPDAGSEIIIKAKVSDQVIHSVNITYYINGEMHTGEMEAETTESIFHYSLGILPEGTNVTFYITAYDGNNNMAKSNTYTFIVSEASTEVPTDLSKYAGFMAIFIAIVVLVGIAIKIKKR